MRWHDVKLQVIAPCNRYHYPWRGSDGLPPEGEYGHNLPLPCRIPGMGRASASSHVDSHLDVVLQCRSGSLSAAKGPIRRTMAPPSGKKIQWCALRGLMAKSPPDLGRNHVFLLGEDNRRGHRAVYFYSQFYWFYFICRLPILLE